MLYENSGLEKTGRTQLLNVVRFPQNLMGDSFILRPIVNLVSRLEYFLVE